MRPQRKWRTTGAILAVGLILLGGPQAPTSAASRDGLGDPEAVAAEVAAYSERVRALGYYYDPIEAEFVVVVSASAQSEFGPSVHVPGIAVRIEYRSITLEQIATISARLRELAIEPGLGANAFGFHFDASLGRVAVISTADRSLFADLLSEFPALVSYEDGEGGRDGRHTDFEPFYGGAEVDGDDAGTGYDCSSGFEVASSSGTIYMVTAGHCFALGETVWNPGSAQRMGRILVRGSFPVQDMELIGGEGYMARIWTGADSSSSVSLPVSGARDPVVGVTGYCRSGARTFNQCSQTVTSLNGEFCDTSGCTPNLIVYSGGGASNGGDSGSPFYWPVSSSASIRGMHIGRIGSNMYAQRWSSIASVFGVSIVVY